MRLLEATWAYLRRSLEEADLISAFKWGVLLAIGALGAILVTNYALLVIRLLEARA